MLSKSSLHDLAEQLRNLKPRKADPFDMISQATSRTFLASRLMTNTGTRQTPSIALPI